MECLNNKAFFLQYKFVMEINWHKQKVRFIKRDLTLRFINSVRALSRSPNEIKMADDISSAYYPRSKSISL